MKLNQIFCGSPASLTEILDARSPPGRETENPFKHTGGPLPHQLFLKYPWRDQVFSHGHPGFRERSPGDPGRRFPA